MSTAAASPAPKVELRRMLRRGQRVCVCGLSRGTEGLQGTVVAMIERGEPSDPITTEGYWTIETHDGLRRDFQRRYLRPERATKTSPTPR